MTEEHRHPKSYDDEYDKTMADLTAKCRQMAAETRALRERCESEFAISDDDDDEALARRARFVLIRGDGHLDN